MATPLFVRLPNASETDRSRENCTGFRAEDGGVLAVASEGPLLLGFTRSVRAQKVREGP